MKNIVLLSNILTEAIENRDIFSESVIEKLKTETKAFDIVITGLKEDLKIAKNENDKNLQEELIHKIEKAEKIMKERINELAGILDEGIVGSAIAGTYKGARGLGGAGRIRSAGNALGAGWKAASGLQKAGAVAGGAAAAGGAALLARKKMLQKKYQAPV